MVVEGKQVLSPAMTTLGMVNGMIGGLILILPIYALNSGYVTTLIVILLTGLFSFYSCYLCVLHMGDQSDLDYAVLSHFNGNRWAKIFYDVCVWLNLILIDMLYYELIVEQWAGLIPPHEFSVANVAVNGVVLFGLVFVLKYFEFGASLMAYGIISIITYLIFLVWVTATFEQGNDSVQYKPFGTGFATLAAAMGQAFSIQSFFIPVLKKNRNPQRYVFYTTLAYIIGGLAYFYIAYMGSVGIWHRFPTVADPQTIEQYFGGSTWEVNIIEAIYLVHLYSVFPEFMLISKKRMFGVVRELGSLAGTVELHVQESEPKKLSFAEVVYFVLMIAICFLVAFFQVNISDIIEINGAVIGFFFIYLIPVALHIRCLYFSKGKKKMPRAQLIIENGQPAVEAVRSKQSQIEITQTNFAKREKIQGSLGRRLLDGETAALLQPKLEQQPAQSQARVPRMDTERQSVEVAEAVDYSTFYCACALQDYSKKELAVHWFLMVVMMLMGLFILVNGIVQVATT